MARQDFKPNPHGSLEKLTAKPSAIGKVAPESPRPPEMLSGIKVHGSSISALDVIIHEFLVSYAYEIDRAMLLDRYAISLKALTRFVGPDVSRDDIVKSVSKMKTLQMDFDVEGPDHRRFKGVPMLVLWQEHTKDDQLIAYSFAPPIRDLMKRMSSYSYLELAALGNGSMSLKYSPALYKHLAMESGRKRWQPGEDNEVYIRFTPTKLAEILQFPGHDDLSKLNVGKLVAFVKASIEDLDKVRRFKTFVKIHDEPGRGKRINSICYTLRLAAPDYRHVRLHRDYSAKQEFRHGGPDDPRFNVRSDLWDRAKRTFRFPGYLANDYFQLWLVALNEALSGKVLTPGYETRGYRGHALLAAVEADEAVSAAWGFFEEEANEADLIEYLSNRVNAPLAVKTEAEAARRQRLGRGWKTSTLEKRAKKYRKSAEPGRTDADALAEHLLAKELREQSEQIEAEMVAVWADIEAPVQKPKSDVVVLSLGRDITQGDFDAEVVNLFCDFDGSERRIIRFEGNGFASTHKIFASPEQWAGFEIDIAAYVDEGVAA